MNFLRISKNVASATAWRQCGLSRNHNHCLLSASRRQWTAVRYLASSSSSGGGNNQQQQQQQDPTTTKPSGFDHLPRLESANPERIRGIIVNPASVGSKVLPGNLVYKKYKWSGNTRKVPLELEHGYFWMMWDLNNTDKKPTLSNESLIPQQEAQVFPVLKGLKTLTNEEADLPFFFVDKHNQDSNSSNKNCTLVALSFRNSGYEQIPTWTDHFTRVFSKNPNVQTFTVSITERWSLYPLKGFLSNVMRNNTPPEQHDKTLLYFGSDVDEFRDVLRMHNIMTNYVFLLDDRGQIRFAGSGPASEEEVARLIGFAKDLTMDNNNNKQSNNRKRTGKRKSGKKSRPGVAPKAR